METKEFEKQHEKALDQELNTFMKECEIETTITSKQFKHKITGKIVTQVPLMEMGDYEEWK